MGFSSGTVDVGEDATSVCGVPESGVQIRNLGTTTVYFGGPDVTNAGYPVEAGTSENFTGVAAKETPVVPAPEGDMDPPVLYACTGAGSGGGGRVSFISVSMT